MIVANVANSKNDEYYTPAYAVQPIIKYLKRGSTVWCPFDAEQSYFVRVLRAEGFNVICTHLDNGQDFFDIEVECNYIISNPPYTLKVEVLERLFELGKPFAMLLGVVGLFDSVSKVQLFNDKQFEVLYLSPRVGYFKSYDDPTPINGIPYQSGYVCSGLLPKQIDFAIIDKKYVFEHEPEYVAIAQRRIDEALALNISD